ncbi:MAG: branched-chain amino acid transport system II carrier protein [Neisseria sp.]|nr:branched-chain amino acid transport system II carrier protein [Neisseria sp.]
MKTLSLRQFISLSFFLFAMFLGAGNIIFAPVLGQSAGSHTWLAMSGFLITGVGLVLLAIIALALSGGAVEKLAGRINPTFAVIFSVALFLVLGPIYVLPRTGAVVYEVAVTPFVTQPPTDAFNTPLFVFSLLFFAATIYLTADISKLVHRVGEIITPVFVALLLIIVLVAFFNPLGEVAEPTGVYIDQAFGKGFTQGYFTMDVLAAFVFGKIFLDATQKSGIPADNLSGVFVKCGIFSMLALAFVQISLSWLGATSVGALGISANGGQALTGIIGLLLGPQGVIILAVVVFLTGLTTAIGCLSAVSEYFSRLVPSLSYKQWVVVFGVMSFAITNFGLTKILQLSSPLLYILYPISITLIVLTLFNRFLGRKSIYIGAVAGAAAMGFIDGFQDAGILPAGLHTWLGETLPFYSMGMGWILVTLAGGVSGLLVEKALRLNPVFFKNETI